MTHFPDVAPEAVVSRSIAVLSGSSSSGERPFSDGRPIPCVPFPTGEGELKLEGLRPSKTPSTGHSANGESPPRAGV